MEAEKMMCCWPTCGKPLVGKPRARFARCSECAHLTCLQCKATHEGTSCAKFQAERGPTTSPVRSPVSLGARSKSYDASSPSKGTRSSDGEKASPRSTLAADFEDTTLPKPQRPSWANASASTSSAGPSHSLNVTGQSTSPSKSVVADRVTRSENPGASGPLRKAICRTEDCGYEKQVDASETELMCHKCRKTTCLVCNAIHGYISCEEYRRQLEDQEEEIQVWCAGKDCKYTVYVGASAQQLKCTLCDSITCIKCQAVHEFQTCEAYARVRRRSNGPQPREATTATTGGADETHPEEEPTVEDSRGEKSESRDVPPACVASAKAPIRREAPRQKEVLVQQAANKLRPSETASERPQPRARQKATAAAPRENVVMVECCACAVESNIEEIVDILGCGHLLCRECVHATAVGALTYIVRCPVTTEEGVSCDSYIQESALKSVLSEEEYALRKGLLNLPIIRCPTEGCSGKFSVRPGTQRLNCPSCQSEYCAACNANHSGITCEQFIRAVVDDVDGPGTSDNEASASGSTTSVNAQQATSSDAVGGAAVASEKSPASFTVECSQCLAETPFGEIVDLLWCGHLLCRECVQRTATNTAAIFVRCPVAREGGSQCESYIQESALKSVLSVQEWAQRKELVQKQSSQPILPGDYLESPAYDSDEYE
ncbi:uncharacterized protein LOC119390082 isoform X2 [Rhipicephalus sanguineus]|uniref:uncharacterized protein LOC119390082 isoform X2 n=1 Tax=Rhipicephalus sanguineus TaxID=34632 RepID=UPI0018937F26|nr:uncharacterized protein LOC119390082 isoform X2 [Rhipicephalus sanguineus]